MVHVVIFAKQFLSRSCVLILLPDGLPAPTNVQLRRVSSTALDVSWDPPPVSGIAGYRIHYNMYPNPDMDKWLSVEIGPYTVAELAGLEPQTSYAVRVRAKGIDGRYGNFSEAVVSNRLENGKKTVCAVSVKCRAFLRWMV